MKRGNRWWPASSLMREILFSADPMTVDIGRSGEVLTAKIRLLLIVLISIIPVKSLIVSPHLTENMVGAGVAFGALIIALVILWLAGRPKPPRSIAWFSTQFDVLLVTVGTVGFLVSNRPIIASNNFVHFSIYLLAIAATSLRADPMVSLAAGFSAVLQHTVVVSMAFQMTIGVADRDYGTFSWDTQIGRTILLGLATLVATAVVVRNRNYWHSSVRDKLTGLHNRRFFDEFLEYKIAECRRHKRVFALVFLDLDYFKQINDAYGHARGDAVLEKAGHEISAFFRDSDLVARYGGEEFTLILPETERSGMLSRLNAFQERLGKLDGEISLSASMGAAFFPADADQPEELIKIADNRMYAAKAAGRRQIIVS